MSRVFWVVLGAVMFLSVGFPVVSFAQEPAFVSTPDLVVQLVDFLVGAVFFVSLLGLVVAGYLYLTSAGNAEASSRAKGLILSSIIGILIAGFSYTLLNVFSDQFLSFNRNVFAPPESARFLSQKDGNDCKCGISILYNEAGEEEKWCIKECASEKDSAGCTSDRDCQAGTTCLTGPRGGVCVENEGSDTCAPPNNRAAWETCDVSSYQGEPVHGRCCNQGVDLWCNGDRHPGEKVGICQTDPIPGEEDGIPADDGEEEEEEEPTACSNFEDRSTWAGLASEVGMYYPATPTDEQMANHPANHPDLNALISCMTDAMKEEKGWTKDNWGSIFTVASTENVPEREFCNYTRGQDLPECGLSCPHSVNSCHYGGANTTGGAMAVDFGLQPGGPDDEEDADFVKDIAYGCGAKWAKFEGDHVHVTIDACDKY